MSMTMKEVLTKLQTRFNEQKDDNTFERKMKLIDFLKEKLGFEYHYNEIASRQGCTILRAVNYDHVCLSDEFNKYHDGRTQWEVCINDNKGEMSFGSSWYDITDKVKSNAERDEVLAEIERLDKAIDKYVEYIDHPAQYRQAKSANERLESKIKELKNKL